MMAKPIRALELHYPVIQFLIITIITERKGFIACPFPAVLWITSQKPRVVC